MKGKEALFLFFYFQRNNGAPPYTLFFFFFLSLVFPYAFSPLGHCPRAVPCSWLELHLLLHARSGSGSGLLPVSTYLHTYHAYLLESMSIYLLETYTHKTPSVLFIIIII